jgi:hypothetical protein
MISLSEFAINGEVSVFQPRSLAPLLGKRNGATIFSRRFSAMFHLPRTEALLVAYPIVSIFDPWD